MAETGDYRRGRTGAAARGFVLALLAVVAACLLIEAARGGSPAQAQPGAPEAPASLIAVTGLVGQDAHGLFLIDPRTRTMCVYRYLGNTNKLQLLAARNVSYDLQLDDYNNAAKSPRDIREIVEKQKRIDEVNPPK
ncbi:MAG: hypothetical protein NTV86_06050 [Planctomycetota bacterium]|nr:hypothetical protein [Planctomycetota bacterium]